MNAYIASGWFNKEQREDLKTIRTVLCILGIKFFSPEDECECPPNADLETRINVFSQNLGAIRRCNFVIVNTRDKDMGSIFEAGYAHAFAKPIIYFCQGLHGSFNLMLSQSGRAVATSADELLKYVEQLQKNRDYRSPYNRVIE